MLEPARIYSVRLVHRSCRPSSLVKRSRRSIILGAFLALLAMINVTGMSIWHTSKADHNDAKVASALLHNNNGERPSSDIDLHEAAHSVIQGLADIAQGSDLAAMPYIPVKWLLAEDCMQRGLPPEALLRPPRG